ncbi:MAG: GAF domain-containing protein [Timaviella obliquedivisa GSE-PSE-MK23-08B]|jgi:signal transduction histidine kinase|nr:GAF domain-containing protein [Timaviella obliquedivisa GSE-PSE-MK23-08B]
MKKDCYTKLHLVQKVDSSPNLPIQCKQSQLKLQPNLPHPPITLAPPISAPIGWMHNYCSEQCQNQIFSASESAQDALLKLSKFLGEIFQADCCFIAASSSLNTCWLPNNLSTHLQQKLWGWFQQPVLKEQWINNDLAIADIQTLLPLDDFPFRSILAICTRHYGKFNGMICLMRAAPQIPQGSPAHAWKKEDLQLLKTLSPQVAIAITQARLEQQAQQQICYQSINDQLTAAIRTNVDLKRIFDTALAGMVCSTRASRGMVLLLSAESSSYFSEISVRGRTSEHPLDAESAETALETKITVVSEYPPACPLPKLAILEEPNFEALEQNQGTWLNYGFQATACSLCQTLLTQTPEPLILSVLSNSEEFHSISSLFRLEDLPSLLLMPIEHQGQVMGCLVLQHCELREWAIEEQSFVKLVAAQLSTAIVQTRSMQHIQAIVAERTAQLQRSLEVQAKLYEKTRQQLEQLRKLDEEREEFLSTVSHELLTPLTSMGLAVRMLQQATLTPDRQSRYLDILEQQCQQETQLINDMLALRKLEVPTAVQYHQVDLQHLVHNAAKSDLERWQKKGLELKIELPSQPLTLSSDPESLNRILVELLNNARKYADASSKVHLKVVHNLHPAHAVVLTLQSVGLGIQPQEIDQIFNKFKRGERATKQAIQGTGLGLALVKRLVEHLNGAIAVSSKPLPSSQSWKTCFTITLPASPDGKIQTAD